RRPGPRHDAHPVPLLRRPGGAAVRPRGPRAPAVRVVEGGAAGGDGGRGGVRVDRHGEESDRGVGDGGWGGRVEEWDGDGGVCWGGGGGGREHK
ncbi:hypothetical protein LTR53_019369, partial [Teratosphaeriaceae sp. CCFEE 6253]